MKHKFVQAGLLLAVLSWVVIGCATIPKESVELSSELTTMLRSAESSHLALVEDYVAEKKHRADDFLQRVWIPTFMKNAMAATKIRKLVDAEKDSLKREQLLNEFNEDVSVEIAKRRGSIMDAIEMIGTSLREAVRNHYGEMLAVNQALTANLKSVADVHKTRDELFATLKIDPKRIVPLDKINGLLEKILSHKDDVESISEYIEQAKIILKGL